MPWLDRASRRAEARFFHLTATRELGEHAEYVRLAEALVARVPRRLVVGGNAQQPGDALHPRRRRRQGRRRRVPRLARQFPSGRHAPRAAWKVGWNAYRQGRHAECAEVFEAAASAFPRSDYRPPWIYWAARSRDQLGDARIANRLYGIIVADYRNSYYGRIAERALTARQVEPMTMAASVAAPAGAQDAVRAASAGARPASNDDRDPRAHRARAL